jgi:hypothetical protein
MALSWHVAKIVDNQWRRRRQRRGVAWRMKIESEENGNNNGGDVKGEMAMKKAAASESENHRRNRKIMAPPAFHRGLSLRHILSNVRLRKRTAAT